MNGRRHNSQRGSLLLVVMCFVAVLAIGIASYVALSSRAMTIGNRSVQTALTKQLAETGLEEALRAFNKNDWSDWSNGVAVDWTLDTTNRRATATMTFPAGKFGQGVTASVKIRVDNYDGAQLANAWSSTANYRIGNLVGYTDGTWYRSLANNLNKAPSATSSNSTYWLQEQGAVSAALNWVSGTAYSIGNFVLRSNGWYRCKAAHTADSSNQPPDGASWGTYWVSVPYLSADADLQYVAEAVVRYYVATYGRDYWFRYTGSAWDQITSGAWGLTWRWSSSPTYAVGAVVSENNVWYRCKLAHSNQVPPNATYWDTASSLATTAAAAWAWSSSVTYNLNDAVYYSSRWYRSTAKANLNNTPSTTSAYWSQYPLLSRSWDSTRQYSANDTVFYNGVRYLSLQNSNYNQNPASQTTWWRSTAVSAYQWNSTTSYSSGVYRSYGGVWYRSLSAHSGQSPNNTTYWTPSTAQSAGVTTGATVVYAEGKITIPGSGSTKTQLRAVLSPAPLFSNAVGASSTLTLSSGGTIDSYDSTVAAYSAGTAGYSAVLAAAGATSPVVTLTSPTVNGYVAATSSSTTPYAPMLTYGGSAVVRGTSTGVGVDLTRVSRSPYVPTMDILNVAGGTTLSLADSTSYTLGTPGAITPTVYNISSATNAPNVALNNASEVLTIVGPVILNISGNLNITAGKISIASTGSAEIHLSGRFRIQNSTGGIENLTTDPKKLIILGTSNLTTHVFQSTTYNFYGAIYLPSGTLTIDNGPNLFGAISAGSVIFSGNANVHYDISLRYAMIPGVDQPYAPSEVRELTDLLEQATMP